MDERRLVTLRTVSELRPIPDADRIELAVVDGWQTVVKKGEFKVGDQAIYLEVDSWVPHDEAPFLTQAGHEPKEYQGVKGQRLRTVRLRGQLSQGLLLPVPPDCDADRRVADLSSRVVKWERPIPPQLQGLARGSFPSDRYAKTDQERIQNLTQEFEHWKSDRVRWFVTEKLDGTSVTFILDLDNTFHVCSRNLDLQETENNLYWRIARKYDVEAAMRREWLRGVAIQGEIVGDGIQGNPYKLPAGEQKLYVFNVQSEGRVPWDEGHMCDLVYKMNLRLVPYVLANWAIEPEMTVDTLLQMAQGVSKLNASEQREGLVFRNLYGTKSFKVVNNEYLLGEQA